MLNRIIFGLGAAITTLIFILILLDLILLGKRHIIRGSFSNIRVFLLLIGIPYIVLFLSLLGFHLMPTYLWPIQLVLLLAYGIGKKQIIAKIDSIEDVQPQRQSDNATLLTGSQPQP